MAKKKKPAGERTLAAAREEFNWYYENGFPLRTEWLVAATAFVNTDPPDIAAAWTALQQGKSKPAKAFIQACGSKRTAEMMVLWYERYRSGQ